MPTRFGFFDSDSRELDRASQGLRYRPRVTPIAPLLERLYALATLRGYPLVFTTCCSGVMPGRDELPGVLQVPLDPDDLGWLPRVSGYRRFYIAKKTYGDPKRNAECRSWDVFRDNPHVTRLLRTLEVETWVVFGNGFDLCVGSAARGVLDAGLPLIVLEDVKISSAGGSPESEQRTLAELRARGAKTMTLEAFLAVAG